jgi:hypothetical protein
MLAAVLVLLAGCGGGRTARFASVESASPPEPDTVLEPVTHQEQLIAQGARLAVSDGCTACHLNGRHNTLGPNFARFAGHRVALVDGRRVLVDKNFLTDALMHPEQNVVKGYPSAPMLQSMRRLGLTHNPTQVAALVAFIEMVGPETP